MQLGTELLSDHADYADMSIEHYWAEITAKEQQGEEYMDYYDDPGLDFFRTITCPYCGKTQKVDLEEFIYDEGSNPSTRDDDMGPDMHIGASHAQIERALRYLREKGIISTNKTEIIVLSTDLLLEECSETLKLTDRSAF